MSKFEAAFAAWIAFHSKLGVNIEATLMPPATEADILAVENTLGFDLPDDMRALYKIANGQFDAWDHREELKARLGPDEYWSPLFGSHSLLPLDQALQWYQSELSRVESEREFRDKFNQANPDKISDEPMIWDVREGDSVDPIGWTPHWFVFAGFNADNLALDMNPPRGGNPGQIVEFGSDVAQLSVLGSSLTDLFVEAADRLDITETNRYERNEPDGQSVGTVFFDMDWRKIPFDHQEFLNAVPQFPIEYKQWQEEESRKEEQRVQRFISWLKQQGASDEDIFYIEGIFRSDLSYQSEISEMPPHVHEAINDWSISRGEGPIPNEKSDMKLVIEAVWYRYYMGLAGQVMASSNERGRNISSTIGQGMLRQDVITLVHRYWLESGVWTRTDFDIAEALRNRFSRLKIIEQGETDNHSIGFEGSVLEICWSTFDSETFKSNDFCDRVDISEFRN